MRAISKAHVLDIHYYSLLTYDVTDRHPPRIPARVCYATYASLRVARVLFGFVGPPCWHKFPRLNFRSSCPGRSCCLLFVSLAFWFLLDGSTKALRQIRPHAHDSLYKTYQESVTQFHLRIVNYVAYHTDSCPRFRVLLRLSFCHPSNCNTDFTTSSAKPSGSSCMSYILSSLNTKLTMASSLNLVFLTSSPSPPQIKATSGLLHLISLPLLSSFGKSSQNTLVAPQATPSPKTPPLLCVYG